MWFVVRNFITMMIKKFMNLKRVSIKLLPMSIRIIVNNGNHWAILNT